MTSLPAGADVLVVGGGNAALCAALAARRAGASVLLVESAPFDYRGGNSRHTRDIRYAHPAATRFVTGAYPYDEFLDDLLRVTGGETNHDLARLVIRESTDLAEWMAAQGVRWSTPLRGTLHLARTNVFMLGGGKAMLNALYATAHRLGVDIAYDTCVEGLTLDAGGRFESARVRADGQARSVAARAVVVASGGFEANIDWLRRYWGDAVDNLIIRGTPYNQGVLLADLLEHGAVSVGDPKQFHGVAVDARAPRFDGGIVTRLDSVPFGIVVNQAGVRFYDEGEDFWPKRYAIWGGLIARQPDQIAYSLVDAKAMGRFMPSVFPAEQASTVPALADTLGLDPSAVCRTVEEFNASVQAGHFDPATLDDCRTEGLCPPKSHWAVAIDAPPFYGYPLRTGVTFTYMGVTVDEHARVIMQDQSPVSNIFAAGEVMAGNILRKGYLAGFGLTIGCVFGRIAGREAARRAAA